MQSMWKACRQQAESLAVAEVGQAHGALGAAAGRRLAIAIGLH